MRGRPLSPPLYVLPHGIEVIGEYGPNRHFPYWRLRIRPHPFFSAKNVSNGLDVHRSRAVMAAKLGRALSPKEHVHHINGDHEDDRPENLTIMSPGEHNTLHRTGAHHTEEVKQRIGASLRRLYADGERIPICPDWTGRKHTLESRRKMSKTVKAQYAAGRPKPCPPDCTGHHHTPETKRRMSEAAKRRWRDKEGRFVTL